jgi:protein-S-isoprenylcysteine O-methyltransferase Ste14
MTWHMLITFLGNLLIAFIVFHRVEDEYRKKGKLTRLGSWLEILLFFLHGCSSYVFLDSRISEIDVSSVTFWLGCSLIMIGAVVTVLAMSRLGWGVAIGQETPGLRTEGFYRYSRNPQLVGYFFLIVGYALFWPSWSGIAWVFLYGVIALRMVKAEESHLEALYQAQYQNYCDRTPRFLGRVKQDNNIKKQR